MKTLVALLIASTALFTVAVLAERAQANESTAVTEAHTGEASEDAHAETKEKLLGIDTESTPLVVVAAIAGLGLAALAASRFGRAPAVLLTIAIVMAAWAALDVREAVHQLDESNTGIALLAIAVAILHLAAAALAARMSTRARHAGIGRSGTMPA